MGPLFAAIIALAAASAKAEVEPPEYRTNEEYPYEYTWKGFPVGSGGRTFNNPPFSQARILEYLREMRERGGVGENGAAEWVPPPRHRPHRPPSFTYTLNYPAASRGQPFALPPSDERFFHRPIQMESEREMSSGENDLGLVYNLNKQSVDDFTEIPGEGGLWKEDGGNGGEPTQPSTTEETTTDDSIYIFKTPLTDINATKEDILFVVVVAGSSAAVVVGLLLLGYGYYRLHKSSKAAADVDYPAYGVTGPNKEATPTGDRRLAHSAQMYHYQLTKQQIIAMESRGSGGERRGSISEAESDEENEEGDYTVYECPGLAPTGEMEVKNPLFQDDTTPGVVQEETEAKSEPKQ